MTTCHQCACGHDALWHHHYTAGSWCAACGSLECRTFRARAPRLPRRHLACVLLGCDLDEAAALAHRLGRPVCRRHGVVL